MKKGAKDGLVKRSSTQWHKKKLKKREMSRDIMYKAHNAWAKESLRRVMGYEKQIDRTKAAELLRHCT